MEVSLELERTIAGNSKNPMMPKKRVFRVGSRIWRVMGLRVRVIEMLIFHQPSSKRDFPINGKGGFKMKINDAVFGKLEYDYVWSRETTIEFCGKEADIALIIDGEEDGEFSEKQYASYNSLIQNLGHLQQSILQPILDYYKQKRHELGYDVSYNENYPLLETINQLLERIRLVGIYVPSARRFEGRYIGLTFDCTWDMENGVGIRLINEEVARVGYQDVAI